LTECDLISSSSVNAGVNKVIILEHPHPVILSEVLQGSSLTARLGCDLLELRVTALEALATVAFHLGGTHAGLHLVLYERVDVASAGVEVLHYDGSPVSTVGTGGFHTSVERGVEYFLLGTCEHRRVAHTGLHCHHH